jgi:hypothetical protein
VYYSSGILTNKQEEVGLVELRWERVGVPENKGLE